MSLSFIRPRRKILFSAITHSWLLCFLASALTFVGFWALLNFQSKNFSHYSENFNSKIKEQLDIQNDLDQQLAFLDTQIQKLQFIKSENDYLSSAIKNLFDLIPEQITINSIALTDKNLVIKGITPSKELYIFLLETPLKAIFSDSRVDFFVLPSGWYNFVSVNSIKNFTTKENNNDQ